MVSEAGGRRSGMRAVNVRTVTFAGQGDGDIVRRAVGPEAGQVSYLTAAGQPGSETVLLIHGAGVSAPSSWPHW
jgi:hypothetical protein